MNILLISWEYPPIGGGVSVVVHGLMKSLCEMNHKVDLITMNFKNLPEKEALFKTGTIHRINCLRKKRDVASQFEMGLFVIKSCKFINHLLDDTSYHAINSHGIFPSGIIGHYISRKYNLPHFVSSHGSDIPGHNPYHYGIPMKILFPLWKKILKHSRSIIVSGNALKREILNHYPAAQISNIYFGVDENYLPYNKKENIILLVGRLVKLKGYHYFINAIKDMDISYRIILVGEGPLYKELKAQSYKCKTPIEFVNQLDRKSMKCLFKKAKLFIHPSISEGFSIVLMEALSSGTPVITTTTDGCKAVVGDAAYMVEPESEMEIKSAIKTLINDENQLRLLSEKSVDRFRGFYTWEKMAENYINLFSIHSQL